METSGKKRGRENDEPSPVSEELTMCQHSDPIDCQSLSPRRKLRLTRAFAVLCVTSISLWGRSPAIGVTKPISGPSSVVFAGDSATANWGAAQKGPEFAEPINTWNAWSELYALSQGISVADYHFALLAEGEHYVPDLPIAGVNLSAAGYAVMTSIDDVMSVISTLSSN
jgi:hypothetical protein